MVAKLDRSKSKARRLNSAYEWKEIDEKVRAFYARPGTRRKIGKAVSKSRPVGYVEGPPTLNNQPHVGHIRGRMMKDLWYRYRTLEGENIVFRGGWDTQGLPVELQAEKELGLSGNKWEDLEKVGVERLVEKCKQIVGKYKLDWEEADDLMGMMVDHGKAYLTYRDSYIEREWTYLEEAWKRGLLEEGFKVVPYCPECQTALSAMEVSLGGYEQLEDPSLYYKVRAEDGAYFILWTTMPFTVVTDELVGVKPDADYEYLRVGEERWVVCSTRKEALEKGLGVKLGAPEKTVKGRDLEGVAYSHPLLDEIPGLKALQSGGRIHKVVAEDYVDVTTGTGLVHISPANGDEDFSEAAKRGVPVFAPFDDRVRFTGDAGKFAGVFARDADRDVVDSLREKGSLVASGKIVHEYPVCWRSGDRLVWLARREYFYRVDKMRPLLVRAAGKVEYFFDGPKNRFLNGLAEAPQWCVTRERVWGAPLPIWVCEGCGEKTGAFSRREIVKLASELPDGPDFELHKPWIDRVVLKCPKCGGRATREPFVLDTWHNSGASPYSSFTDDEFHRLIPVGFLTEGIDQTRAWAYTLLVLNVLRTGKPQAPYEAFLFQGHVLDEKGEKMSKSLGNVIQGLDFLRDYSVDAGRLYVLSKASPEDSVSVRLKEVNGRPYQVRNPLYPRHVYLQQNGAVDGYDPGKHTVAWASKRGLLTLVDRWLMAKVAGAERKVLAAYGGAKFNESAKVVEELVINHLSQTYVRLVRSELWKDDPRERGRRLAIYALLGEALKIADGLLHPISPIVTALLHQEVFAGKPWDEPMLASGRARFSGTSSASAEATVDFALRVEEACNSARERAKLKRRWPLRTATVLVRPSSELLAKKARKTVALLCNVKEAALVAGSGFPATFRLTPNGSRIGALCKERTREVLGSVKTLEGREALRASWGGKPLKVGSFEVPLSVFELAVSPKEGFEASEKGGVFVAISTARDDRLVAEGLVRDVARRLQALRKEKGYVPTAMLASASVSGLEDEDLELIAPLTEEIAFLVRVRRVELSKDRGTTGGWSESELDGRQILLKVG